jgi:predicted site-specific integrase-resolvase
MKWITLTEWAEMLSINPHINTLTSWARNGHIPGAKKFGRVWLVPRDAEYQQVPVSDRVREILGAR